ncbi:MAG: hypothetical protein EOP43_05160 [Sphingobacteriaceae bacterium]|nr:MAG: hypothetical protein EOP43_05160 [Sphingobacteriaceae bacterium]
MFSNELAQELIRMPKSIEGKNTVIDLSNEKSRFTLSNSNERAYEFLFEITSHRKITFKISLHNQENNTKEGLMRVDYRGGHQNPASINDLVPDIVKQYAGYFFQNEPHIHLYVEGFKDLAWAVPLTVCNFPVLDINSNDDYMNAIMAFAEKINIVSPFNIQNAIL